jgi:hypothetical protein
MTTLWLESGVSSREGIKAMEGARKLGYEYGWGNPVTTIDKVPVGSVDFCESWLGYSPVPDFYPEFLDRWLCRAVARSVPTKCFGDIPLFVKSAERYKAFPARIYHPGEQLPDGMLDMSEVVEFVQEWRYYVADGCVLATGWYDGEDEDEPAPSITIPWPKGFCGAVDFGRLKSGQMALVESHHPYAAGNYTDDSAAWTMWLVEGWRYMLSIDHWGET